MLSACNLLKNNINDPKALTSKDMVSLIYSHCPQSVHSAEWTPWSHSCGLSLSCCCQHACLQAISSLCGQGEHPAAPLPGSHCEPFPEAEPHISSSTLYSSRGWCIWEAHLHVEGRANCSHSAPFCVFCFYLQNLVIQGVASETFFFFFMLAYVCGFFFKKKERTYLGQGQHSF